MTIMIFVSLVLLVALGFLFKAILDNSEDYWFLPIVFTIMFFNGAFVIHQVTEMDRKLDVICSRYADKAASFDGTIDDCMVRASKLNDVKRDLEESRARQ